MRKLTFLLMVLLAAGCASTPADPPVSAPQPQPRATQAGNAPKQTTVTVTASVLNVRREPSAEAEVVGKVSRGDELAVISTTDAWTNVRLASGETGWVSSAHVSYEGLLLRGAPKRTAKTQPKRPARAGCPADTEFSFTKAPLPEFSEVRRAGLVVVDAYVDVKGNVTSTKIISNSTGDPELAKLAEREIRTARFAPPIRNCVPKAFIFSYKRSF